MRMINHLVTIFLIFSCTTSAMITMSATSQADPRSVFNEQSPQVLAAIGKLTIPSERKINNETQHFIEDCSATLVRDNYNQHRWLLSAWHCFENYTNLGRPITLKIRDNQGIWHARDVHVVVHGGSMQSDWALLRAETPLPKAMTALPMDQYHEGGVTIAGFSGDDGLGASGERLTYQENCMPSTLSLDEQQITVDCLAFKGASGGAVIQRGKIVGIVSQGDNEGRTSFVSHTMYGHRVARKVP